MEKSEKDNTVTVQGVMPPVPAALGSAQAGYQSSSSSACNVTPVSLAGVADNATSNEQQTKKRPSTKNSAKKKKTPTISFPDAELAFPKPSNNTLALLGDLIVDLMRYVKPRNNVHYDIKAKVISIRATYIKICNERENRDPREYNSQTSQTSPIVLPNMEDEKGSAPLESVSQASQTSPIVLPNKAEAKRSRDPTDVPCMEMPKRKKQNTPKKSECVGPQEEKVIEAKPEDAPTTKGTWMAAGKKKKKRLRRPKPDTMIISAKGEVTYADILKKIRTDPDLVELGNEVNKVRRTQKGDLMLELKTTSSKSASRFHERIEKCLEGRVAVRTHKEETIIECKDLDDITTKQEISDAFEKALEISDLGESSVKSLRKSYGGTQSAKISLPAEAARKALELGKIKIGWSLCRIRETRNLTLCYRCLEYGHISKSCTAEEDRSHKCRKCGGEGHISKDCVAEPNCILCKSYGSTDLKHIAGSYRCPVFKKALSAKYK